ncbi:tyrosine-protein phosphatase [Maribacter flavus]|uniref:protein-tyrosine-phosphatase n=1 Tax=Maribacter flavus TaxID=1658664 RepID=A0A5B2TRZ3_9FLAO|nr:CpsB/CapC family capsule biosynthesis tyrosine phosphatase [Maribacter flavus]KAA2217451.1 histidinol phosphatase [Maribacter flavus]
MFSFFTKKHFLIDHLNGFVDIHNHILPGIDDGAKTVEDSLELIKGFGEFGVSDFICTPHIMENYYPNTPDTIHNSLVLLKNGLKMNDFNHVRVEAAAEHMIDAGFEGKLGDKRIMPLADSYILIEMSYLQPSLNLFDMVEKISERSLYPILAHPERYNFLHGKLKSFEEYKNKGMLLQLNILSLSGYYGKEVQKTAMLLLNHNLLDFIATDIHNPRQLKALKEMELKQQTIDLVLPIIERTTYNFK